MVSKKQRTWNTWSKQIPGTHERTLMLNQCGQKCFLGKNKTFPICNRGTCKKNRLGILAAYVRANEYKSIRKTRRARSKESKHSPRYYQKIAQRANRMLHRTRKLYR